MVPENDTGIALSTPLDRMMVRALRAGQRVMLSGDVLVFRDQVHRILAEMMARGEKLPFDLENAALYYCGPTPPRGDASVGSAGPTTSSRMDPFTGPLVERGLLMTIGKGNRSPAIAELLKRHGAVYMLATGGAGALLGRCVTASRIIAFPELGPEAARIFTVKDLPLIVGIDSRGESIFVSGKRPKATGSG